MTITNSKRALYYIIILLLLSLFRLTTFPFFQILRNRELQSWSDRGQQAQGGYRARGRFHSELQTGESDDVRMGNPRQTVGRGCLYSRQRAQRLFDQPVSHDNILKFNIR